MAPTTSTTTNQATTVLRVRRPQMRVRGSGDEGQAFFAARDPLCPARDGLWYGTWGGPDNLQEYLKNADTYSMADNDLFKIGRACSQLRLKGLLYSPVTKRWSHCVGTSQPYFRA